MKDALKAYAWAMAATLVMAALIFALGTLVYEAGRTNERVIWQAKEVSKAKAFTAELRRETQRGEGAAAALSSSLLQLQSRYSTLEGQYRELSARVPLVVPAAVRPGRNGGPANAAKDGLGRSLAPAAADRQAQHLGQRSHGLSRAAVWMWNSSLAGADVPVPTETGACGAADTSSESCAADTGLTVDDAWANHHINAKSCAADRVRHRALIEFITERPAQ